MPRRTIGVLTVLFVTTVLVGVQALAQAPPAPAPAPAPAPTPPAPAAAPAGPVVESMKIICDGKAKNDGAMTFVFAPAGGEAKEIRVTLQKGMKQGDVCRDVAKELSVALSGTPYKVDHYDPDKVKIAGEKEAKFSLALGGNSVTGLTIELK